MILGEHERRDRVVSSAYGTRRRVARLLTEVFAPSFIAGALLIVIAFHSASTRAAALGWSLLGLLFVSLLPLSYVIRGVRRRRLTDRHVGLRQQRPLPLLVGIGSVIVGLALLTLLGAPHELIAVIGTMIVGLAVALLITLLWKISIHTGVAAGSVVIVALVFGREWLALGLLVGLIGWARVELGDHTPSQVVGGAIIGAVVAAVVFSLVR